MSAIRRQDVIADDVFTGFAELQKQIEQLVISMQKINTKIGGGNLKNLASDTKEVSIADKELAAISAQVEKAKARQSEEYVNQQKELNKLRAEQKNLTAVEEKEVGTLQKLTNQNKALTKERQMLNLETLKGQQRLIAINKALDQNNLKIKQSSDAMTKQRMNIGNYTKSIQNALPMMGSFGQQMGYIVNNLNTMRQSMADVSPAVGQTSSAFGKLKFALVGLGIGAIILAVAALVAIFKTFDPLVDKVEQGMAALGAAISVVKDTILSVVTGNGSFSAMGAKMALAASEAANLKKQQQELDDQLKISVVTQSKYQNKIDKLLIKSKDLSKTEAERTAMLNEAISLEKDAYEERRLLAERDKKLWIDQFAVRHGLNTEQIKDIKENGVAALIRLQETLTFNEDEIQSYTDKELKIQALIGEHQKIEEKALNRRNRLIEIQQETEAKNLALFKENERKKAEATRKALEEEIKIIKEVNDSKHNAWSEDVVKAQERTDSLKAIETKLADDIKTINEKLASDQETINKEKLQKEIEADEIKKQIIADSIELTSELFRGFTDLRITQIQAEMDKMEFARNRELEAAGDNERLKSEIDKKYDSKRRSLQKKQANAEKANALFNIAIGTAQNIIKAFSGGPVLIALAAGLGAAQAAFVASRKVPEFDKGSGFTPDSFIAGEKRPELMKSGGEWSLVDRPTMFTGHRGSKIVSGKETDSILGSMTDVGFNILKDKGALLNLLNNDIPERTKPEHLKFVLEKNNKELIHAIQNKKEVSVSVNNRGARVREKSGSLFVDRISYYYGR